MRYVLRLMCVLALGLIGCSETSGTGGSAGDGGVGGDGGTTGQEFPCSEQGIRAAIAAGGGPYTFDCDGPTTVETEAEIVIDNDVILDGEGNLTVDGNEDHRVFSVATDITAELRGFTVSRGDAGTNDGGGIYNEGTFMLTNSTVSDNFASGGSGIFSTGTLTLTDSTVSNNVGLGGAIANEGTAMLTNSTVSGNRHQPGIYNSHLGTLVLTNSTVSGNGGGNRGGGISNLGTLTLTNSTVSGNEAAEGGGIYHGWDFISMRTLTLTNSTVSGNTALVGGGIYNESTLVLTNSLIDGECFGPIASGGYNIESPGDTCGFDINLGDQVNVTAEQLNLGPLQDNGGPTETHALLPGSDAIDRIPTFDCIDYEQRLLTDQRGFPRDCACDVGAFEVQGGACPPGWDCPPRNYGAADGCHCGCGVIDPDCADSTVDSCDYCDGCGGNGCPGLIEPTRNWECAA